MHALELFKAAPTCEDADVVKTMRSLGDLYRKHGQLANAERILLSAITGCNGLGPEHQTTLAVAHSLSVLYVAMGNLGQAEKLCQHALIGFENLPNKNEAAYSSMLAATNTMAKIYAQQGRRAEAEKSYLQLLELYDKFPGPEDLLAINTVNNLAGLYVDQKRLEEAEKLSSRAVRACVINLGPNHSTTLDNLGNLGIVCEDQGKLDEAEELCQRAVDGFQSTLGPSHPSTRKAIAALANLDRVRANRGPAVPSRLPTARGPSSSPDRTATGLFSFVRTALHSVVSSVSENLTDLCHDCRDLDLQKAMSYMKVVARYPYGLLVADIGSRLKENPDNGCPLCEMLFSTRVKPLNEAEAQVGDEIRASSFVKWYEGVKETFILEDPGIALCVVPKTLGVGQSAERMIEHFREYGQSFCYDRLSTQIEILFPQLVKRNFDSVLVQRLLEFCRKYHKLCAPKSQHVSGLKLIDCKTYTVVPAPTDVQYVALSYVWGQVSAAQVDRETSTILASTLPPVISDVVQVTTALGFQYLWVDQYCIDQDNPALKQEQLTKMDLIYHTADLTIVAAAGTNQGYGLPGIDSRPRTVQRAVGTGR
jgi:tetratricopeptide (TPR) repeat protein